MNNKVANYEKECRCPHNEFVVCSMKKCTRCGWNPDVAKARLEKIRQERQEDLANG